MRRMKISLVMLLIIVLPWTLSRASQRLLVYPQAGVASLTGAIDRAHSRIDLVMYGFTDKKIMRALVAAHKRGVKVRVLLQQKPYKAEDENTVMVSFLRQAGITVQWSNPKFEITHQKTMVIDGRDAIIMSFNFTYPTFSTSRNFAIETTNPKQVAEIEAVFNADWHRTAVTVSVPSLVWSPENAQKKLVAFIRHAKSTLLVYNQEMAQTNIIPALAKAASRGVKVRVLVPYTTASLYCGTLSYLRQHGVKVRLDKVLYIHAKAMLRDAGTDGVKTFVGSTNFSDYGLNHNRELGIISASNSVARKLGQVFNGDWKQSLSLAVRCKV